ncbi:MAG TPA: type I polyketide synthase, partial [Myxococcota bacterium]|nr:type I polyketide synthase [Myxococcota bacterium]
MADPSVGENDIAIVGMALRVPGADSPTRFWQNLREGVESIVDLDEATLLAEGEDAETLRRAGYVGRGGALDGVKLFDRDFFGFSPKEAAILDPQHRHFMELCWEALEDAGHTPRRFEGPIGVYAGCGMGSYFYFHVCSNRELVDSVGLFLLRHTGNDKDFLATRVSYVLDLKGPSVNVQTACSTSLVATHLACQSLLTGECDLALAGGVTIQFPTLTGYLYRDGEILSPDGHCRAFDHRAKGTVLTSGAGVVALRRLEDAIADGDDVYAVIKGSAVNNDGGQKVGYLAPSVNGQAAAMTEAYSLAGVEPSSIGLIECHGTGTYMGDPIEVAAMTQAFRTSEDEAASRDQFCRIGSVKTNIGHLDTAAGVVGLMKAALALKHGEMPPSLNFEAGNPEIGFERTPFVVNDALTAWPAGSTPRRAAVNSLGVGGTNAHVVLEEAPPTPTAAADPNEPVLLQLSAKGLRSLDGACKRLAEHLRAHPALSLADVGFSLQRTREEMDRRRVLVARSRDEAIDLLESLDPRRVFTHSLPEARASVAFLFSGGGSQYPGMTRSLYEREPVLREHVDRGLRLYRERTGFDLRELLFGSPEDESVEARLTEMVRQLPAIFIVEYAMVELWASRGVEPAILIGHSMGENVAACVAGVLSYEACLDWLILRGRLFDRTEPGGMIAVSLPPEALEPHLAGRCDLAAINAPGLCVASGSEAEIDALEKRLDAAEIDFQRVAIGRAAHSRLLDPILDEFRRFVQGLDLQAPRIPIVSNRTGRLLTEAEATDPEYWVRHLRECVHFSDGLATVLSTPGRVLVEVGPGQALSSFARQQPGSGAANVVPSIRHKADRVDDADFFLASLGRLWASGVEVDLESLYDDEARRRVRLPTYAWNHESYFIERVAPTIETRDEGRPVRLEDVADWGFVPTWQPAAVDPRRLETPETFLLFMDQAGVGRRLRDRLVAAGHAVVCVFEADNFRKRSESEYSLAPELGREGYEALVKDLAAAGRMPTRIVHLWLTTDQERFRPGSNFFHENLQHGFFSLYFLARALADESLPGEVQLTVVSNGLQHVLDGDGPLYPEKATVLGPVQVVPRELPGVTCRSVDVTLPVRGRAGLRQRLLGARGVPAGRPADLDEVVQALEAEVLAPADSELVAWRGRDRFVRRFEPRPLPARRDGGHSPLVEGGTYLITGGLGGLGLTLADRLAREVPGIRLVLLGRTPLPDRADWDRALEQRGANDAVARRIRAVRALEAAGAEVQVLAADVTNLDEMRRGIASVRERLGGAAIDGVFHAAGTVADELIQLKQDADIERVFGPKVHGTQVIDALLEEMGARLLVLYSSTSSLIAPAGQVDYVAANAFLDAYATRGHAGAEPGAGGGVRTVAVNWGIWNEVGLAAASLETPEADATEGEPSHVS